MQNYLFQLYWYIFDTFLSASMLKLVKVNVHACMSH